MWAAEPRPDSRMLMRFIAAVQSVPENLEFATKLGFRE
jgi:hypothetical protein